MRRGLLWWLVLLVYLLLAACTPHEPVQPLRIGSNQWIGYEPVYLARSMGWLDEHRVRLVELPSSTQVMRQIASGNLDGGMLTLDEVLTLSARGVPLKVVALMDFSNGADALIGHPGMALADLRGKRIGVENTAVGAVLLDAALEAAGLTPSDVHIVPLEVYDHVEAFKDDEVDAVVTFDPSRSRLLAAGGVQLFDSSRIPGRIIDVLAIHPSAIEQYPEQVRYLVDAYYRALEYMQSQPQQACERIAPRLHLDADAVCRSYAGIRLPTREESLEWLASSRLDKEAARLAALMRSRGLLEGPIETGGLGEARFLVQDGG